MARYGQSRPIATPRDCAYLAEGSQNPDIIALTLPKIANMHLDTATTAQTTDRLRRGTVVIRKMIVDVRERIDVLRQCRNSHARLAWARISYVSEIALVVLVGSLDDWPQSRFEQGAAQGPKDCRAALQVSRFYRRDH